MGDFNAIRGPNEKIGGAVWGDTYCDDLNNCCREANLDDLRYMGNHFTWSNSSVGQRRIACKLDRALVNEGWSDVLPDSYASFLNPSISDHSPCVVTCGGGEERRKVPFKFYNMWANHGSFIDIVKETWKEDYEGSPMFNLVSKLKGLKGALRRLNKNEFWNISDKVIEAKYNLEGVQNRLQINPLDEDLAKEEKTWLENYWRLSEAEESLARQKAKGEVKKEFVNYFKEVLNATDDCNINFKEIQRLVNFQLESQVKEMMIKEVEEDEIKATIFAMDNNKAPGPDGYGAFFFKAAWEIVGSDVIKAIKHFFSSGHLLKEGGW
ncbi:uncharacterized protein LOC123226743 [Mangifera indica]|uniref:uncharacterized protein LOC123226743 n=1 Tax=Mangifera indica TaxID=29780 RepID=UPI001CFAF0CD|nr:uncharacterized protein LOC123226743 [Mangifera indica]